MSFAPAAFARSNGGAVRLIMDTSALIRYLIRPGAALRTIVEELWLGDQIQIVTCPELLAELEGEPPAGAAQVPGVISQDHPMTDLLAAVITLEAQAAGELDPFQGRAMHALFLDLTGRAERGLATALHESDALKPFTSSNLIGLRTPEGAQRAAIQPGALFRWRVTTFEPGLTRVWRDHILPGLPQTVTVGEVAFAVRGWTADAGADGWAGVSSYAELTQQHTLTPRPPGPWINLRFASPTTFRSGGNHVPLPIPSLMLGHWLEKWNAFAPLALHPDVRSFAEEQVVVNRYDLRTEPVSLGPATIIGFVGQCSLTVKHDDPYWRRIPHLLAAFSFWGGTGHKTTQGLGQTRVGR
jgi:CRISPR-associated endoribonuclease Cas6